MALFAEHQLLPQDVTVCLTSRASFARARIFNRSRVSSSYKPWIYTDPSRFLLAVPCTASYCTVHSSH